MIVVDTLPPDGIRRSSPATPTPWSRTWPGGCACTDRDVLLAQLAALGCPAVPWRGPGTLDDVLHRLARRAQLPRVRVR